MSISANLHRVVTTTFDNYLPGFEVVRLSLPMGRADHPWWQGRQSLFPFRVTTHFDYPPPRAWNPSERVPARCRDGPLSAGNQEDSSWTLYNHMNN